MLLRDSKKSDSGAAAMEFAMLAPVLALIFMAIIELSVMFFVSVNLDGAAIDAARRIRTGQAQSSGNPESDFTSALCANLNSIISCGDLYYDSRVVGAYSGITLGVEYDEDTGEPITYGFNAGGSGDIIVIRVMYMWSFNTPLIGSLFETSPGSNKKLLISTAVFQSEPYE